jgi:hypothetical protein
MPRRYAANPELRPSLPPVELRKSKFVHPNQQLETPLTSEGLVDTRRLVKLVHGTLNSVYKWPSGSINRHHLYWPNPWYPDLDEVDIQRLGIELEEDEKVPSPHTFRNNALNQMDALDSFHAWLHETTSPPVVPTINTIRLVNKSHSGKMTMAEAVKVGMQLMRDKEISSNRLHDRLGELFEQYKTGIDMIGSVPPGFRGINIDEFVVSDPIEMLNIRGSIGHLAVRPSVAVSTRIIRQDTIAEPRVRDEAA